MMNERCPSKNETLCCILNMSDKNIVHCIDVVGCLEAALEGSEVKRSRKQIANQLVKQCLVMDRKELHRKTTKESKG